MQLPLWTTESIYISEKSNQMCQANRKIINKPESFQGGKKDKKKNM